MMRRFIHDHSLILFAGLVLVAGLLTSLGIKNDNPVPVLAGLLIIAGMDVGLLL
jgi:hypothetical protein